MCPVAMYVYVGVCTGVCMCLCVCICLSVMCRREKESSFCLQLLFPDTGRSRQASSLRQMSWQRLCTRKFKPLSLYLFLSFSFFLLSASRSLSTFFYLYLSACYFLRAFLFGMPSCGFLSPRIHVKSRSLYCRMHSSVAKGGESISRCGHCNGEGCVSGQTVTLNMTDIILQFAC